MCSWYARVRSQSASEVVSTNTTRSRSRASPRRAWRKSKPFIRGMLRSRSTMHGPVRCFSGCSPRRIASPARPSSAQTTGKVSPCLRRLRSTASAATSSSSTRTMLMPLLIVFLSLEARPPHVEGDSAARVVGHDLDAAAVTLDQALGDGEPDARPLPLERRDGLEQPEHAVARLWRDSRAVVADREVTVGVFLADGDGDLT